MSDELNLYQGIGDSISTDDLDACFKKLDALEKSGLYVAETKEDGIFVTVHMTKKGNRFISRNGLEKFVDLNNIILPLDVERATFVGELGYGSQASYAEKERYGLSPDQNFVKIFRFLEYKSSCQDHATNGFVYDEVKQREVLETIWSLFPGNIKKRFRLSERRETDFVDWYKSIVAGGGEGIVLKLKTAKYLSGADSPDWIKVKKTIDVDMVVMDMEISNAATYAGKGFAKYITCGMYKNGTLTPLVNVGSMTQDWRYEFGTNFEKYKGQVVEIHAFEQFVSGSLRHPSFSRLRPDKKPEECIFNPRRLI